MIKEPRLSKSRPWATRRSPTRVSRAGKSGGWASGPASKIASRSQYEALRKAMRSRSRSTISRVATDCTRPADNRGMTFFHSTGRDLVAVQTIKDAPGLLGVDQILVKITGVGDRLGNGCLE